MTESGTLNMCIGYSRILMLMNAIAQNNLYVRWTKHSDFHRSTHVYYLFRGEG